MNAVRHVRIFKNGRSRAVRIPKDWDVFGDELVMRQDGDRVILECPKKQSPAEVIEWLRRQPPLGPDDDFPEIDDPPPEPVDLFGDSDDDA